MQPAIGLRVVVSFISLYQKIEVILNQKPFICGWTKWYAGYKNLALFLIKAWFCTIGEDEKLEAICYQSEKLALAFRLIKNPQGKRPIRILKNICACNDFHAFMKFVSNIIEQPIILRDSNRFHHFVGGHCSCKDLLCFLFTVLCIYYTIV